MRWDFLTNGVIEMTSDTIGGSYGMLGRHRLPKLAKPRSPTAVFCKRRQNRLAFVPLPPDVFRELRSQAAASGQTPSQLMAAILTRAAGK